ncbi:MAG: type II secretion system protein [Rickettsiales bacterium]
MHQPSTIRPRPSAFSLVELSIVLVILGLLVGGILSGQALIRAAELRAAIKQFEGFTAASLQFRDKYMNLPADGCNNKNFGMGFRWCDDSGGNNNGLVEERYWPRADSRQINGDEFLLFWNDLTLKGFISEGIDSSLTYTSWWCFGPACQPRSKLDGNLIAITEKNATNYYYIGNNTTTSWINAQRTLTPMQLYQWDTKIDDGAPSAGRVMTVLAPGPWNSLGADVPGATACTTSSTTYNTVSPYGDTKLCAAIIHMGIN